MGFFSEKQCNDFGILSPISKNFVKSTFILPNYTVSYFHEIFQVKVNIAFFRNSTRHAFRTIFRETNAFAIMLWFREFFFFRLEIRD